MNIQVNKSAKAYSKQEVSINAPVQKVYTVLSDINNWAKWQGTVRKATLAGEPAVGKEFNWKAGSLSVKSKIHTANPFSEFGWTGRIWWITAVHNWTLKEQSGKCIVTVEESLNGLLPGLMRKSLQEDMIQSIKELKSTAEMN